VETVQKLGSPQLLTTKSSGMIFQVANLAFSTYQNDEIKTRQFFIHPSASSSIQAVIKHG